MNNIDTREFTLNNGLTCYIIKRSGFTEKQAMFAVNYGSCHNDFTVDNRKHSMPLGVAHFLEHKLFEQKNIDVFDEFTKNNASANAFTNFNQTAYYFNCTDNFSKNLKTLLSFVSNPSYTSKSIEKEKSIISQEIKMYDDNPDWCSYFNMLKGLYSENPVRNNIAGTVDSIQDITKEMLDLCYNSFYTFNRAVLVCCGDVDEEEICNIAEKYLKLSKEKDLSLDFKNNIKGDYLVNNEYIEQKMHITQNILNLGFKDTFFDDIMIDKFCLGKICLDILASPSSMLYEKLYINNIINDTFFYDYNFSDFFAFSYFSSFTDKPIELKNEIVNEIKNIKEHGISIDVAERIRRKRLGALLRLSNSIDGLASLQLDLFSKNISVTELYNYYENINIDKLNNYFNKVFDLNKMTLSIVTPQ